MDDKNFDQQTALDWISGIEKSGKTIRDDDIYPKLNAWISQASPLEILEIGSGQGICSDKIDLNGRKYTGLEPSPFMTNRAKELYSAENRTFILGNAYDLPFTNEKFDAVFSVLVWHLLGDLQKATHELSRVLKDSGHFLIITANPSAYSAWKDLYTNLKIEGHRLEGTMRLSDTTTSHDVLYLHTFDEIKNALQNVNLKVLGIETFRPSKKSEQKMFIAIQGQKTL